MPPIVEPAAAEAVFQPRAAESWRDPFPMYRALRDHDPVHHVDWGDFWVLSRFRDVFDAAIDFQTFSSADGLTFRYGEREQLGVENAPIVMMDPPEHTELRKLVSSGFTPRRVSDIEDDVRSFVVERVERLREMGEADVVAELIGPLPSFVVAHYLGVPQEDRTLFDRWTDGIVAANAAGDVTSAGAAVVELYEYFTGLIERRRKEPGDDMISALVQARIDEDEVPLIKILGFAFTMVTGGNDTTTGLLGGSLDLLTRHPEQRALLLEDPARIGAAIEEFLRLTSPVQGLARTTTRDVTIDGTAIPKGKKVMLLYASANRDEREFGSTAEELDVERRIKHILTFSYGPHHCIGAAVTRLQARIALEELLVRCPRFSVDGERGIYASGHFVRRYETLPFHAHGLD
ncbi:MAG: cytochrome P450 [Candidatus Binatia bacterium]